MPNREKSLQKYKTLAATYDRFYQFEEGRQVAVRRIGLSSGEAVLDAGCGTGLNFGFFEEAIGPDGAIVAIDQCPEMIERARARIARHGWQNITLITSPVEEAVIPFLADVAFFFTTHDLLRTPRAVENVLRHIKPGGRVLAAGVKLAGLAHPILSLWAIRRARDTATTLEGLSHPWSNLESYVPDLDVEELGGWYVASGVVPGAAADRAGGSSAR